MKSDRKIDFPACFDKKRQDSVFRLILSEIKKAGCEYPSVISCCEAAEDFLASPTMRTYTTLMQIDALASGCSEEYYHIVQVQALFKKRSDIELGVDKCQVALDSFLQSEGHCRSINRQLRDRDDQQYADRAALIFKMQRKISLLLGSLPDFDDWPCGFGPGTNIGCSKNTSVRFKLDSDVTTTEAAARLFMSSCNSFHAWTGLSKPTVVCGSRWTSVPKTSLTDRGINVEPILNAYMQKGLGSLIRTRLKRAGINLNDQTANQLLARDGSIHNSLCTIDLSMASDTVSYLLVMDLLPYDWFAALDAVRSPTCQLPDGSYVVLEKFSSMGNGATFELESLIFWAVLAVVCDNMDDPIISVYGDDLICPASKYAEVLSALSLLGFIPNSTKSFGDGPFRESCGKDYWEGTDVRPVFCKEEISVKEIYRLHNFFKRNGRYSDLPSLLLTFVRRRDRYFGPDGYGDGHLLWDSVPRPVRDKRGWMCFHKVKTFSARPRRVKTPLSSDYGAFLYLTTERDGPFDPDSLMAVDTMMNERSSSPRYALRTIRVPVAL